MIRLSSGVVLSAALLASHPAMAASSATLAKPATPPAGLALEALLMPEIGGLALSADGSKVYVSFATYAAGGATIRSAWWCARRTER